MPVSSSPPAFQKRLAEVSKVLRSSKEKESAAKRMSILSTNPYAAENKLLYGANELTVEVEPFITTFLHELFHPFYVFQVGVRRFFVFVCILLEECFKAL